MMFKEDMSDRASAEDYHVSRQEESEALSFIKKYIVGEAVGYFEVNKASYGRRHSDVVDAKKLATNLKKVAHFKIGEPGNPSNEADYIEYEGYDSTEDNWPPTTFRFVITKELADFDDGRFFILVAGYKNPLRRGENITTVVRKIKRHPQPPLKESIKDDFEISKQEEQKALQFIRKNILVGPLEKVGKALKKTTDERIGTFHFITFSAWVDGMWHGYRVTKDPQGLWVIRLTNGSAEKDNKWLVKEEKYIRRQPETVPLLSRREKDEAFQMLKLFVFPKAIINTNSYLTSMGKQDLQVTREDVIKHLNKKSDSGNKVVYESKIPGKCIITFFIEKKNGRFILDKHGKAMVYMGYIIPDGIECVFSVHPPKKSLQETIQDGKPIPSVTKREELWALSLLKKHYVKEFPDIGKHLHKFSIHPTVQPEIRSDQLMYEYHGKKRAMFSIVRTGAGLWIIMWPEGEKNARDHLHLDLLSQTLKEVFEKPISNDGKAILSENDDPIYEVEKPKPILSKKEELYAFDLIKKRFLPKDLEVFNNNLFNINAQYKRKFPGKTDLQPLTLQQALKLLRKDWQGEEHGTDCSMYVIHGTDDYPSMHYFINKNYNHSISIYYEELKTHSCYETLISS